MIEPVERALDVGILVLRNGGSTAMADLAFRNVLAGAGLPGVTAIWRLDLVAAFDLDEGRSSAILRPVGPIGINLDRVSEAVVLSTRSARGEVPVAALHEEIDRIERMPAPYGRWVMAGAAALASASFARLAGGDWPSCAIVLVAAAAGQGLRSALQARRLRSAPVTLFAAVLSASLAALGLRLGLSPVVPATLIASVIYMVPGLALINGFLDIVAQRHPLSGWERLLNAAFLFLLLAVAIAFAYTVVL